MKICAVTMVYRDYWALAQWYGHYGRQLGFENLFIVSHGQDERIRQICPAASVIRIPRDQLGGFDRFRSRFLNALQASLLELYDWVIRTDADELICIDPEAFVNFESFFRSQRTPAIFALGLELVERPGQQPVPDGECVFEHRDNAVFSGHYSKAWAVSQAEDLVRHGVQVRPKRSRWFPFNLPSGVYLAHLKFADSKALLEANRHRQQIAAGRERGLPGKAWREADAESRVFYQRFEGLPEIPWEKARAKAFDRLSRDPKRIASEGLVRARQLRFKARTKLPPWFKGQ